MKPENEVKMKFGGWGLVCGAVITMIIGFAWGGWTTAGTTQEMNEKAVLVSQADICVAQFTKFMKDPVNAEKLEEFEKLDSWNRYNFIEKGGWDTMPGEKEAVYGVARACADKLELYGKK
jgi:hypothetical protein